MLLSRILGATLIIWQSHAILPYLKGLYDIIYGRRNDRDCEGWKNKLINSKDVLAHWLYEGKLIEEDFSRSVNREEGEFMAPENVMPMKRSRDEIEILMVMMEEETSEREPSRFIKTAEVICGFTDDSGRDLGSMTQKSNGREVHVRIGACNSKEEEDEYSNWREFNNVMGTIEEEGETGQLTSTMVLVLTDNSMAKGAVLKGNSPSRYLFY